MRLRTDLFVSALLRRAFAGGGFAAVLHKGAEEAGAIFLRQRSRLGLETLYGPAPQSLLSDDPGPDRLFEQRLSEAEPEAVEAVLERELRFDRIAGSSNSRSTNGAICSPWPRTRASAASDNQAFRFSAVRFG